MKISNIKRCLIVLFLISGLAAIADPASEVPENKVNEKKEIEVKSRQAQQQIHKLKLLEKI